MPVILFNKYFVSVSYIPTSGAKTGSEIVSAFLPLRGDKSYLYWICAATKNSPRPRGGDKDHNIEMSHAHQHLKEAGRGNKRLRLGDGEDAFSINIESYTGRD